MEHKLRPNFESSSCSSKHLNKDHTFSQFNPRNSIYNPRFSTVAYSNSTHESKIPNQSETNPKTPTLDWDPRAMLTNLSFLEQKIHQIQDLVHSVIDREGQISAQPNELAAHQQAVTADLTYIIIQLISTASTFLPSTKNTLIDATNITNNNNNVTPSLRNGELMKSFNNEPIQIDDQDVKDSEDGGEGENLPIGSYEVLQLEKEEILAPHTHFCSICGKGFKRDANLRMHMRGHGDEYKTLAALAKPVKDPGSEPVPVKRYSCPFIGCKRNKEHKKFQPLKTILCVKNHYKRSHCDKSYTCSRCNSKKFSVSADLKTHEKHCGRDKWLCSCGTTFSRKDKLFGHVALFQGHTPMISMDESNNQGQSQKSNNGVTNLEIDSTTGFIGNSMDEINMIDIKGVDDDRGYFSPMNFDSCNFAVFDELTRQFDVGDVGEGSFAFNFMQKNGENASSSDLA